MSSTAETARRYPSPFLLDKAKLSRIITILEARFRDKLWTPVFSITLRNGKIVKLPSIESVLALDNTLKNPIRSFSIASGPNASDEPQYFELSFDQRAIEQKVTSDDAKWARETFAEVEEQVERTLIRPWLPKSLVEVLQIAMILVLPVLGGIALVRDDSSNSRLSVVQQKAVAARTVEEKIDFIFTVEREKIQQSCPFFSVRQPAYTQLLPATRGAYSCGGITKSTTRSS